MKIFKSFLFFACIATSTFFIYSCVKEETNQKFDNKPLSTEQFQQVLDKSFESLGIQNESELLESRTSGSVSSANCTSASLPVTASCTTVPATHTISLPASGSRPACNDMKLTYLLTVCFNFSPAPGESPFTFIFENFEAWPGNCPAFITWYNGLSNADKATEQDKWEFQASILEEQMVVQTILTNAGWLGCQNNWSASSSFNTNLCYSRCLEPIDEWPYWKSEKSYCGSQCCLRKTLFCVNISGALLFQGPTYETVGTSCTNSPPSCRRGGIPLSPECGVKCGPL